MPTNLEEWANKACLLDKQYRVARAQYGGRKEVVRAPERPERRWTPRELAPVTQDPNAMDINRNRSPVVCYTCSRQGHQSDICRQAIQGVSCAYCKAKGHRIADCRSPNKKPFAVASMAAPAYIPAPLKTRANDFNLDAMPESEIAALKARLQDF